MSVKTILAICGSTRARPAVQVVNSVAHLVRRQQLRHELDPVVAERAILLDVPVVRQSRTLPPTKQRTEPFRLDLDAVQLFVGGRSNLIGGVLRNDHSSTVH